MRLSALFLLLALPTLAAGQTSFPMVTHASPVALERGKTSEVTVSCRTSSLAGAYRVLFEGEGISAEPLPPKQALKINPAGGVPNLQSLQLKVTVAADAALGVREFRIATRHGISSLGQLVIVDSPVVPEKTGNNTPDKAVQVPVPSVVCGRIEVAENVDYYKFTAKAGQILSFEVFCARLEDKIHDLQKHADPLIAVYDATGKELAASDDGFFADPVLSFAVPKDGEYRVAVRDAKYDGDPRWVYALTVTDRPFASQSFPLSANPGQTVKAAPVGSAAKLAKEWTIHAPAAAGITAVPLRGSGQETNPVPLVVTPLPLFEEKEPNDSPKDATRITLPCGANGRIGVKRDLDHFVFTATKGKAIRFQVYARRFGTELRSELDSQLDVMTPAGKILATNDDLVGKDAGLVFTPPADGDFIVRIRDLNNKGGDGFVYFLECDFARPDFSLKCDPSKAMIGPGTRTAWFVQVARTDAFAGPVKIEVKGLPAGVAVNPLTIPANMTTGLLVVSAAKDAPVDAAIVKVTGTGEVPDAGGKPVPIVREAAAVEEIYLPGGGRGRFDAGMQSVAVTTPSDIAEVKVSKNRVVLKPGEEVKIDVEVVRGGYDKAITLDVPLRHLGQVFGNPLPPGVTMVDGKSKTLLGTGSKGSIVLKAAADAPECTDVPVCVQSFVAINFVVKIGYCSEVIWVSVKK
ncbi:MAG TPA: PPC domain-containing protein [Gemmata sp.]|nr:PPC domain-containing protein [Gemmata sp.]